MLVYLNGDYIPQERAMVPVTDRGFLFADGVYEVVRIYGGRLFLMEEHMERLRNGLAALRIRYGDVDRIADIAARLIGENGVEGKDGALYIQATRGAPPKRAHAFPQGEIAPTIYISAYAHPRPGPDTFGNGVECVTVSDTRWSRCDIKSVSLLANVLANQFAHERGAFEALFVRDGVVLEGSHSNLFAVYDGALLTYPASNYTLPGITRSLVLEVAAELGIPVRLGPILEDRLMAADELFLSGTTTEVMPVVRVDGEDVGDGRPGAVSRRLQQAYEERAGI
ncbi:MAG TPA: aminotransferase class IV [Longimicrobiales bacterium]|nr:aminotransferase class IV [Longimicrobiales bacterium]